MKKIILEKDVNIGEYIEAKIAAQNVLTIFHLADIYKLKHLAEITLSYIERCFAIIVDSQSYLELKYKLVAKLLSSSGTNVDSELQIFNAAHFWVQHKRVERKKYALKLLQIVRLPLLSESALKYVLKQGSSFTKNLKCREILIKSLGCKNNVFQRRTSKINTLRYCSQESFQILVGGGRQANGFKFTDVNQINSNDFTKVNILRELFNQPELHKAVSIKDNFYVFGCVRNLDETLPSVERCSFLTKKWNKVAQMKDNRERYSICAFMNYVYLLGGKYFDNKNNVWITLKSCLRFNTNGNSWLEVAEMKEPRCEASCAVFLGNLVVTGGYAHNINIDKLNTVESYDVVGNKWSSMPPMLNRGSNSLVVIKDKLFVIRCKGSCEVFDNVNKTFIDLEVPKIELCHTALSVGNKLVIIHKNTSLLHYSDVNEKTWHKVKINLPKRSGPIFNLKVPYDLSNSMQNKFLGSESAVAPVAVPFRCFGNFDKFEDRNVLVQNALTAKNEAKTPVTQSGLLFLFY